MIRRRAEIQRTRGAAALEFLGVMPLVIIASLIALQFGVAGWTIVSANEAARSGARASSLGEDARKAAEDSLPGVLKLSGVPKGRLVAGGDGYEYTVAVETPSLLGFMGLDLPPVERSATMPVIR